MSKHVFILGAGASRDAEAPLMADFLERAELLFRQEDGFGKYDLVFDAISKLQRVHSKSDLDLYNLESVFGAFEMGRTLGRLVDDQTSARIPDLIQTLKLLICETLEKSVRFDVEQESLVARKPYHEFAQVIQTLSGIERNRLDCTIITFNYDLVMEQALLEASVGYDYCVGDQQPKCPPLLKLHGSVNWGACARPECRAIVPYHINRYLQNRFFGPLGTKAVLPLGTALGKSNLKHCNEPIATEPLMVPPSWNKLDYARDIAGIWQRAAQELSNADNIFVLGYSLPETDSFFRHLYALGSLGDRMIKRFWVFDPDPRVEHRFRRLLGPAAASRFGFNATTFRDAVRHHLLPFAKSAPHT